MPGREDSIVDRVRRSGVKTASSAHLLAIGLSRRPDDADASENVGHQFLKKLGRIQRVAELSHAQLSTEFGLEDFEVLRSQALIELGRRAGAAEKGPSAMIETPEDIYNIVEHLRYEKQENFVVVALDAKNKVISSQTVHVGTLTMSVVGPREVFRFAVREGASSIIIAHNHPSGDPTPSPEDLQVTRKLVEIGDTLDIPVLDHVIVGDPRCLSFKRRGLI